MRYSILIYDMHEVWVNDADGLAAMSRRDTPTVNRLSFTLVPHAGVPAKMRFHTAASGG